MSARVVAVAVGLPGIVFILYLLAFLHYRFKKKERNDRLPENCVKSDREGPA